MRLNSISGIRFRSFAAFGLAALALWAAIAFTLHSAERKVLEGASAEGRNLARSLAEHVAASVRIIDLALLHLREDWRDHSASFGDHVAEHQPNIKDKVFSQVTVIKADGHVAYSYLPDPQRLNLADRKYFSVHKERGSDELYISEPFRGRLSGEWIIQFTRAIRDRQQQFAGVLVLTVPPPALERVYNDIELGDGATITLLRADGQILARSRDLAATAGVSLADVPGLGPNAAPAGEYRRVARTDGLERLYRYQKVGGYPLTVYVGQSVETILAPYRAQRTAYLASGVLATALLLAVTLLLLSRRRDREEADRSRARLETELRQSEKHLRLLFNAFPIAIAHVDRVQRISFANRIYHAEYGSDPRGRSVREFVGATAYFVLEPYIQRALAGEEVQFERSYAGADGEIETRSLRYVPDRDAAGEVAGFFALREDITERRRHETELRRFRAAMDAAADAIYLIDRTSMRFIDVNQAACRMHMRSREQMFADGPAGVLATTPEQLGRAYDDVIAGVAGAQRHERQRPGTRGTQIWVEVERSAQHSERGWMIVVVVRDITERKQAEEKIRMLNEDLERRVLERTAELRAAIRSLQAEVEERQRAEASALHLAERVQNMARRLGEAQEVERRRLAAELHDGVCSNLAAIGLNLVMLQRQLPMTDAAGLEGRLSSLIGLIDEAKANARDISVDLRPLLLDERDLLSALEDYGRKFADSTGIAVEVRGADSGRRLPPEAKIALFRITQEALTNCAKHAGARAVAIEFKTGADHLLLSIADDGVGIDLTDGNGKAHGLGLLSMQERAEAIGATWSIDSVPGAGTRVSVRVEASVAA